MTLLNSSTTRRLWRARGILRGPHDCYFLAQLRAFDSRLARPPPACGTPAAVARERDQGELGRADQLGHARAEERTEPHSRTAAGGKGGYTFPQKRRSLTYADG